MQFSYEYASTCCATLMVYAKLAACTGTTSSRTPSTWRCGTLWLPGTNCITTPFTTERPAALVHGMPHNRHARGGRSQLPCHGAAQGAEHCHSRHTQVRGASALSLHHTAACSVLEVFCVLVRRVFGRTFAELPFVATKIGCFPTCPLPHLHASPPCNEFVSREDWRCLSCRYRREGNLHRFMSVRGRPLLCIALQYANPIRQAASPEFVPDAGAAGGAAQAEGRAPGAALAALPAAHVDAALRLRCSDNS